MIDHFYSDPHFGHANILDFCHRPFIDSEHQTRVLIALYQAHVQPNETVLWLGDCFFGNEYQARTILDELPGRKVLVVGNHDKSRGTMAALGFDLVADELVLRINGRTCRACHYPYDLRAGRHADSPAKFRHRKLPGEVLLHGHSHGTEALHGGNQIDCGVDAWDYRPASYAEVARLVAVAS